MEYYDKTANTQYKLSSFALDRLSTKISDIQYTISGFNSTAPTESQTISISLSSATYHNTITTSFVIQIKPEYIVSAEVIKSPTSVKQNYAVNETINFENFKIKNTYSNNRTEIVNVTNNMISEFDTSVASTNIKQFKITQNGFTTTYNYTVSPSSNYTVFNQKFVKCFIPSENAGFTFSQTETNIFEYSNPTVASVQLGYYSRFSYTKSAIIALYDTSTTSTPNVVVSSYETQTINDIDVTICKFKYKGSSTTTYTAVYFDRRITFGLQNSLYTIEILFIDYANNTTTTEMLATLINSIN